MQHRAEADAIQSACIDISHEYSGRLSLLSARTVVTLITMGHQCS